MEPDEGTPKIAMAGPGARLNGMITIFLIPWDLHVEVGFSTICPGNVPLNMYLNVHMNVLVVTDDI